MRGVPLRRRGGIAAFVVLLTMLAGNVIAAEQQSGSGRDGNYLERLSRRFTKFVVTIYSRLSTPPG